MPTSLSALESIFFTAREIAAPGERSAYLDRACGNDPDVRRSIERMLAAEPAVGSFLEAPAAAALLQTEILAAAAPLGAQIGPYKLRELLGEGGFGLVYVAEQEQPIRRKVALKVIKPGMDTKEVIARFEAERQALALMDHPNIAKVLDAGTTGEGQGARAEGQGSRAESQGSRAEGQGPRANGHQLSPLPPGEGPGVRAEVQPVPLDHPLNPESRIPNPSLGRPYFVMELVRGLPITDYCDQAKLPLRERLKLFITVCQAVQHAHQKGIIHRDIKPSNVLIALHDGTPVPKVIDFGVAKALNQRLTEHTLYTRHAQMLGTPMYMSPEQAELSGLDVDTRSDVYSLGVLLYELLTGQTPFDKDALNKAGFDELRRMIRDVEPSRPSQRISTLGQQHLSTVASRRGIDERQLSRTLKGELDWIVMKALEKDRTRRYAAADALAADLQRFLDNQPVQARPQSTWYTLKKFASRNRQRVVAAGLVAGVLLAVVGLKVRNDARLREVHDGVAISLSAARAAFEANDLDLAAQYAAEAGGRLMGSADALPELAAAVEQVRSATKQRPHDVRRMQDFESRTRKAMEDMFSGRTETVADQDAIDALKLYSILEDDTWLAKLQESQLTEEEQVRVRATAYETLLVLADNGYRWRQTRTEDGVRNSLDYLRRAALIREPSRAFYWVRADCYRYLKESDRAEQDQERFRNTPAETAFDYFLPGHTAGWKGDRAEAHRSYEEALRIEPDHFNSLFFLAMRLNADHRHAEAAQTYRACLALRPDHCPSLRNRAQSLLELPDAASHHPEALELSSKAISLRPGKVSADYYIRALIYRRMGDLPKALADAEQAVAIDPNDLQSRLACGIVLFDMGHFDRALEQTRKAIEIAPDDARAINNCAMALSRNGQREEAIALLQRGIALHSEDRELQTNLGGEMLMAGRLDDALAAFQRALELEPKVAVRHFDVSCALDALERRDDQIAALRKALEIDPDYTQALNNLGFALRKERRFDEAIEVLKKAIALEPKARNPHLNLASILQEQQLWDAALAEWRRVVEIDPDFPCGYCEIGNILWEQGNLAEAVDAFNKAIERAPNDLAAHGNRAMIFFKQQRYAEAVADLDRCLLIAPTNPQVYNNLAWLYCTSLDPRWRNIDKALELATRATDLDPRNGAWLSTLGASQYRAGQFDAAIASLQKATELGHKPEGSDEFIIAMSYWRLERHDEGRRSYERAVKWMEANGPDDDELVRFRAEAEDLLGIDVTPVGPTEPPVSERRSQTVEDPVH